MDEDPLHHGSADWLIGALGNKPRDYETLFIELPPLHDNAPAYTPEMLHDAEPAPVISYMKVYLVFKALRYHLSDAELKRWKYLVESRVAYKEMIRKLRYKWSEVEDSLAYDMILNRESQDIVSDSKLSAEEKDAKQRELQVTQDKNLADYETQKHELRDLHNRFMEVAVEFGSAKQIFLDNLPLQLVEAYNKVPDTVQPLVRVAQFTRPPYSADFDISTQEREEAEMQSSPGTPFKDQKRSRSNSPTGATTEASKRRRLSDQPAPSSASIDFAMTTVDEHSEKEM